MEELLTQAGLSEAQASAYLFLLEHGASAPPAVARGCRLTRTNAYKVLDSLQEIDLASKQEKGSKFTYEAADPTALASLVAEQRSRVLALEQNVKTVMHELRRKYRHSIAASSVKQSQGTDAIVRAYTEHVASEAPIYFVKSRADIPFMGFETMDKIRRLGVANRVERYGITPDAPEVYKDRSRDIRSFLTRTFIPVDAYTAPVEWSASGNELLIVKFDGNGDVIKIVDNDIAEAFRQLWALASQKGSSV